MGKQKSEREKKLQRKLIPLNIIVCIIALVAAISLFLTPILKVDVGKILRDDGTVGFIDEKIDEIVGGEIDGTEQEGINYKPVVAELVKNILGKAEGEVSVSAVSAFHVLTGSGDKSQIVMDDLLFGEDALATTLINSVVDGVANLFETDEGKSLLEDAVVSTMTKGLIESVDNETVANALSTSNVKDLVNVIRELSEPENVPDGKVDAVAGRFADKLDEMLGDEINIDESDRQAITEEVQKMYDTTKEQLGEGENVSIEAIICVTISQNVDLSEINIEDLLGGLFGDGKSENGENSVHISTVEEEVVGSAADGSQGGEDTGNPSEGDGSTESGDGSQGGDTSGEEEGQTIITNYNDLLLQIGFDEAKKEELKENMRSKLNAELNRVIEENGVDDYMGYYGYIFFAMLLFIIPWLILFLFSFFHMLAKNKRFTMWYVKLICWIPPLIWLVLKLFPVIAPKISFLNDLWNGEHGAIIKAAFAGIGSLTWISGLCYLLLWFVSIFWAFPIKRKIRKERKNPRVEDAYDDYDDD